MEARSGFSVEARYRRADGAYRILRTEARPRFGDAGAFLGMIGVNVDVTDTREAEAALRASERRLRLAQEAGGIGAWEHDLTTGKRYWSDSNYRLWGLEPGATVSAEMAFAIIHPDDRARAMETVAHAATIVGPLPPLEIRIIRPSDRAVRWILSTAESLGDANGQPVRHIGVMRDVTEQKEAMERLKLLTRELDHRAKNALAVVQAALRLTPRDDAATFARSVEGRVSALARAHTLLAEGRWRGTDLRAVVEGALAPFLGRPDEGANAELEGPPVALGPAAVQALSMALHELATNAAKHGALSSPTGRLVVTWELASPDLDESRPALLLDWQESGGPPVAAPPARRGFGGTVVEATIARQLGGQVAAEWHPDGLRWHAAVPLARLVASHAAWEGP
jgi:PAS domain S-box-containing protein